MIANRVLRNIYHIYILGIFYLPYVQCASLVAGMWSCCFISMPVQCASATAVSSLARAVRRCSCRFVSCPCTAPVLLSLHLLPVHCASAPGASSARALRQCSCLVIASPCTAAVLLSGHCQSLHCGSAPVWSLPALALRQCSCRFIDSPCNAGKLQQLRVPLNW